MPQEWTGEVVSRMHLARIKVNDIAEEAKLTPEYVSMVLNGHRDPESGKAKILEALARLEAKKNGTQ